MEFFEKYYGKQYAPNTRETVRRQTVHQFMQAALIMPNPDKPSRPTNSPKAVYQIEPSALKCLPGWKTGLEEEAPGISANGRAPEQALRPGTGHGAHPRDVGELGRRSGFHPAGTMPWSRRSLTISARFSHRAGGSFTSAIPGKSGRTSMPPSCKSWASRSKNTGKCPMSLCIMWKELAGPDRGGYEPRAGKPQAASRTEDPFAGSKAGLVFVTAFHDRHKMMKYLDDISWETEVWVAESPTHLIHFNGERFLGPYE